MSFLKALAEQIQAATGRPFAGARYQAVSGGCINQAVVISAADNQQYFVKFNDASRLAMFEAEREGLHALAGTNTIRVPRPLRTGIAENNAFIVMECLDLGGNPVATDAVLGDQLAALHRATESRFGWHRGNTIGSTPQSNEWHEDWIVFYRERRLRVQIDLAARRMGAPLRQLGETLMERLPEFFQDYRPAPSLLHGDLWSGNVATMREGDPVIFDPAVYYGDREADIAMTELFGGFSADFYAAYRRAWPLDPGYETRKSLYNLYHVLNHFNLFGGGYGMQAQQMMQRLLNR